MGLQGKKLGLWDYTLFEIGITEIMFEIGISVQSKSRFSDWDYGITCLLKLGLRDYTPFEIGILGLQYPPLQGPIYAYPISPILVIVKIVYTNIIFHCYKWYDSLLVWHFHAITIDFFFFFFALIYFPLIEALCTRLTVVPLVLGPPAHTAAIIAL